MKKNDKIKQMYASIHTPEYDVKDAVLNEINNPKSVSKFNGKVLLVAVMVFILLIATAGVAGAFDHIFVIRDISSIEEGPTVSPTPIPEVDENQMTGVQETNESMIMQQGDFVETLLDFVSQAEYGEYRKIECYDEYGMTNSSEGISIFETDEYARMLQQMNQSNFYIPIPNYIPDGYTFKYGRIEFYLDERVFSIEPTTWEENGFKYTIYKLPDDFDKNIFNCSMLFENNHEEVIEYRVMLFSAYSGVEDIYLEDDVEAEYIEIEGFDDAVLLTGNSYFKGHTVILYTTIEPIDNLYYTVMDEDFLRENGRTQQDYKETHEAVIMSIYAGSLKKNEIIKIAQGLVNE